MLAAMRRRHVLAALTIAVVSLVEAGCTAGLGQGIADRVLAANSPIVREVVLSPENFWNGRSGDAVYVYLVDGASDLEAPDPWCNVVYPPGVAKLPVGQVILAKGGEPAPAGGRSGTTIVLRDPVCP
jgi:hypothetical protein